jgi:hypothetical protein
VPLEYVGSGIVALESSVDIIASLTSLTIGRKAVHSPLVLWMFEYLLDHSQSLPCIRTWCI